MCLIKFRKKGGLKENPSQYRLFEYRYYLRGYEKVLERYIVITVFKIVGFNIDGWERRVIVYKLNFSNLN